MHFVIDAALGRHFDEAGREHGGNSRRSEQHLAEEFERLRPAADRDLAHVPDHRPFGIEIGGADEKPAPLAVLRRDLLEKSLVHIVGDDFCQRRIACKRISAQQPSDWLGDGDVLRRRGGEHRLERLVVFRSEKSEGRGERAGRDAGDEIEFGPLARGGPAAQHARPERAVRPAARQGQKVDDGTPSRFQHLGTVGADLRPLLLDHGVGIGRKLIAPEADGRRAHAHDLGLIFERSGHRIASDGGRATRKRSGDEQRPHDPRHVFPRSARAEVSNPPGISFKGSTLTQNYGARRSFAGGVVHPKTGLV